MPEQKISRQKVLLLPPLKGLNLFDNPFTMSPDYAIELINFLPPTTELKVRPAVVKLTSFFGAIKGIFSYAVGATKRYGTNWYDQTIEDGEYQALILKICRSNGQTEISAFNPMSSEKEILNINADNSYSSDFATYKHSLMYAPADPALPMNIWSARTGWQNMKWTAPDQTTSMTDLENVCFYNGMILANARNTFDIFIADADKVNPKDGSQWNSMWTWFTTTYIGDKQISLEGIAKKGGAIMKMFTMSQAGLETINSYFCVCTNLGEIIVWQGELAEGIPQFKLVGRFEIPIPLNKDCFCVMEGDTIVATQNGLFSLNRVVFGRQTEITNSIETRILNVFDNYMFKENSFSKFFGLYYYQNNRSLIFNVPSRLPTIMNMMKKGFEIDSDCYLLLDNVDVDYELKKDTLEFCSGFIKRYLYLNWLNYGLYFEFNNSYNKNVNYMEGIFLTFETVSNAQSETQLYAVKTSVNIWITQLINGNFVTTQLLKQPMDFYCSDFTSANPGITYNIDDFGWNQDLKTSYGYQSEYQYYQYRFKDLVGGQKLLKEKNEVKNIEEKKEEEKNVGVDFSSEITEISPVTSLFANATSEIPILFYKEKYSKEQLANIKYINISSLAFSEKYLKSFPGNLNQYWWSRTGLYTDLFVAPNFDKFAGELNNINYPDANLYNQPCNQTKGFTTVFDGNIGYGFRAASGFNPNLPYYPDAVAKFSYGKTFHIAKIYEALFNKIYGTGQDEYVDGHYSYFTEMSFKDVATGQVYKIGSRIMLELYNKPQTQTEEITKIANYIGIEVELTYYHDFNIMWNYKDWFNRTKINCLYHTTYAIYAFKNPIWQPTSRTGVMLIDDWKIPPASQGWIYDVCTPMTTQSIEIPTQILLETPQGISDVTFTGVWQPTPNIETRAVPDFLKNAIPEFTMTDANYDSIVNEFGYLFAHYQCSIEEERPAPTPAPNPPLPPVTETKYRSMHILGTNESVYGYEKLIFSEDYLNVGEGDEAYLYSDTGVDKYFNFWKNHTNQIVDFFGGNSKNLYQFRDFLLSILRDGKKTMLSSFLVGMSKVFNATNYSSGMANQTVMFNAGWYLGGSTKLGAAHTDTVTMSNIFVQESMYEIEMHFTLTWKLGCKIFDWNLNTTDNFNGSSIKYTDGTSTVNRLQELVFNFKFFAEQNSGEIIPQDVSIFLDDSMNKKIYTIAANRDLDFPVSYEFHVMGYYVNVSSGASDPIKKMLNNDNYPLDTISGIYRDQLASAKWAATEWQMPPNKLVYTQTDYPPLTSVPRRENTSLKQKINLFKNNSPQIILTKEKLKEIKKRNNIEGDTWYPTYSINASNYDLKQVPFLKNMNVLCNYKSKQYVMNSYYGTWAEWEGINMIAGQSHLGDFYFIRPDDVPAGSYGTDFIYNTSVLCKFDPNTFGDFDPDDETKTIPINVSYLTPSSNLGINQLKIPQRITITGTSSTFWGDRANNLRIMAISDYQENPTYWYQYVSPTGVERVMKRMGIEKTRELKSLNFKEKKEFKKLYLTESSIISSVDISLLCKPANRIGLYMHMDILEANIIIYGYEIYLKVMNKV